MEALLGFLGGWEGAAGMILSSFKDTERQKERRPEGGRGKDGGEGRLKGGGGRLDGLQRWR